MKMESLDIRIFMIRFQWMVFIGVKVCLWGELTQGRLINRFNLFGSTGLREGVLVCLVDF